jgi:hypothetical protein
MDRLAKAVALIELELRPLVLTAQRDSLATELAAMTRQRDGLQVRYDLARNRAREADARVNALEAELALEKQLRADVAFSNATFIKQIRRLQSQVEELSTPSIKEKDHG